MRARSIKIIDLSVHTVATIPLGTSVLDCSKAMRALHVGSRGIRERAEGTQG